MKRKKNNIEHVANVPKQQNQSISQDIQKSLEIIMASSSTTQDFLSKLTQLHTNAQEKTSNSFGNFSDKVQNMMLIASSTGTVIPTSLNNDAMIFSRHQAYPRLNNYWKAN